MRTSRRRGAAPSIPRAVSEHCQNGGGHRFRRESPQRENLGAHRFARAFRFLARRLTMASIVELVRLGGVNGHWLV